MSYCWEDDNHNRWVEDFAARLCGDGVNVTLDKWNLEPGGLLPAFMERAAASDFVLFICTPVYKQKSDKRLGGVGYESNIITAELLYDNNHRKYIPLLRKGKWREAAPAWALGKKYFDFSEEPYGEETYRNLLETLFGIGIAAPAVGGKPIVRPSKRERLNLTDLPIEDKR